MKKNITTILLTVVFLFVFTSPIVAQTLTVTPLQGNTATTFAATLSNSKAGYRHCIRGFDSNNDVVYVNCDISTNQSGSFSTIIGPFTAEGQYTIRVTQGYDVFVGSPVAITIAGKVSLRCGDYCPPNSTDCPKECPSVHAGGGIWKCQGSSSGSDVKPVKPTPCPPGQPKGIMTALGCIPTEDPNQFAAWFLKLALGIGGGIAFLLIIFGSFRIITAGGSPDGIKNGSEMITSALMGLLFILFSVFLLHLIGVDILQIPGFRK